MYKFAVVGKANSGKNTLTEIIFNYIKWDELKSGNLSHLDERIKCVAFADPIKKIIEIMFPTLNKDCLYGSSELRSSIIPGAFKNGEPLTVRQLLIDIGTGVGRSYNENIWIDNLLYQLQQEIKNNVLAFAVSDVRFVNECKTLKENGFYLIKLIRDSQLKIDHISETDQDSIPNDYFNYILHNDGSLEDLHFKSEKIFNDLKKIHSQ